MTKNYNVNDLFVYRVGPVKTSTGVSLQGDFYIGYWAPGREGNYIHGVPDARDVAGPFESREEAETQLERMKGEA